MPPGILSGIGFVGAGAIGRRGNKVLGVTTAATLWFVTVIGLCSGGGQVGPGLAPLVVGLVLLSCLRWGGRSLTTRPSRNSDGHRRDSWSKRK
ncbi:MAG: MgtC/SapB family protein [Bryobacteraceae bacterium]